MSTVTIEAPRCSVCGQASLVELDREKFEQWCAGAHVQAVWPEMPKEQREVLISGTHPACWKQLFA